MRCCNWVKWGHLKWSCYRHRLVTGWHRLTPPTLPLSRLSQVVLLGRQGLQQLPLTQPLIKRHGTLCPRRRRTFRLSRLTPRRRTPIVTLKRRRSYTVRRRDNSWSMTWRNANTSWGSASQSCPRRTLHLWQQLSTPPHPRLLRARVRRVSLSTVTLSTSRRLLSLWLKRWLLY
jgi:hypothetical protein